MNACNTKTPPSPTVKGAFLVALVLIGTLHTIGIQHYLREMLFGYDLLSVLCFILLSHQLLAVNEKEHEKRKSTIQFQFKKLQIF